MRSESITDIGSKRKVNQDNIYNKDDNIGLLSNLYIVADGMGGHKAGDYASRECVNSVVGYIEEHTECYTPISLLENAIESANNNINEQSNNNPELEGMGTTIVAATIVDNTMYVANVGDSRLYLIRDDKIEQITEDHSLVEEMVKRGEITPTDARMHPNKNIITRALGANKDVMVDFFEIEVDKSDRVLLCSDGLTNMVEEQEIADVVNYSDDMEKTVKKLVQKANQYGGKDNISVVLVEI